MTITLRPHQVTACQDIDRLFASGAINVCSVQPTGSGKTIIKAEYARRSYLKGEVCFAFAHRDVLLSQISDAMCLMGVPHSFIAADTAVRDITNANVKAHGNSFYDQYSPVIIISVNTFAARIKKDIIPKQMLDSVKLWLLDETHHLTQGSIWGRCVEAIPNARGLGVTATPLRGDKKGLGRDNDGYFDIMSCTSDMWSLIQAGKLTPYKIFTPPNRIDLSGVNVTSNGDYNQRKLGKKVDKREITGDAVDHYLRVLNGKPVITFCVSIEHSEHVADQFNKAGVPSKAVSSKTPLTERNQAIRDLREGRVLNLVNCDLFSEGFDCPSVTGVIMLRPTQSYSLYKQQFGRALRPADGKTHGILLDHVGNTRFMMTEYGLTYPHDDPEWTLERRSKRKKSGDSAPLAESHSCPKCANFWIVKDYGHKCPECGHDMSVKERENEHREIQVKEGELVELSVDAIDTLMQERTKVDLTMDQFADLVQYMPDQARYPAKNNHAKRLGAQQSLRQAMQEWCVKKGQETGWSVDTVQREFEVVFKVNIFKAQVLGHREANELEKKVRNYG